MFLRTWFRFDLRASVSDRGNLGHELIQVELNVEPATDNNHISCKLDVGSTHSAVLIRLRPGLCSDENFVEDDFDPVTSKVHGYSS